MATQSPFQLPSSQQAAPAVAATQARDVQGKAKEQPAMDLYRTFSPSEVAFWDLKCASNTCGGSGNGAANPNGGNSPTWSNWFMGGLFGK